MDRAELRARVGGRITRCDWQDFRELAEAYGFTLLIGKGSRRRFVHEPGFVVSVHEPHPAKRPVKALLRAIDRLEVR